MTREEFLQNYWSYYRMLEQKFLVTLNYVALSTDNAAAYSNEYAGLIQMIGAEMDSFFKVYCGFSATDVKNIAKYYPVVISDFPEITTQNVAVRMAGMTITPFSGWNGDKPKQSLFWWKAFDNIKHSRTTNIHDGCQKNVVYALAALYLLEMKYLQKITAGTDAPDIPNEKSAIFSLPGWKFRAFSGENLFIALQNETISLYEKDSPSCQ